MTLTWIAWFWRRTRVMLWISLAVTMISATVSADNLADEDTIKAVFSYSFGKFTEWPESVLPDESNHLNLCILGENAFSATALAAIEGKRIKGKVLHIEVHSSGLLSSESRTQCHILYISQSEKNRLELILGEIRAAPILTVSDISDFASRGGMIGLIEKNKQIRFNINGSAINQSGLRISSKLYKLANTVLGRKNKGRAP